ncbi:MAG: U32 family peptidase [Clostridia bacterium]|nr:U32 family peptidase [Clostridia bacterium]
MPRIVSPSPEILAPAGGMEQLYAAVRSGADAVYLGAADFNARRNADNFTGAQFSEAVRCCKERGVKTYITLNTLLKDAELPRFLDTLRQVAESGADAVIVQDLAAAEAVRRCCPTVKLHASTQMAVHNVSGARFLQEQGFSRVVLARELTLEEIAAIAAGTQLEIEVFVHGAHCMSASGLCYLSAVFGGRSGNRGLCAQPCRLDFHSGERPFALSLKDMSLLGHLRELADAGVCSFKIEGRMKRPEYCAAAVRACIAARNGESYDEETLRRVFSRDGFTDGYLAGRRDLAMFGSRSREDVTAAAGVFGQLQALYKDEPKRAAVEMKFFAVAKEPSRLTLTDGAHTVTVTGAVPEPARTRPLDAETCSRLLTKLGGTPYVCSAPVCEIGEGLTLSAAAVNALRRDGIAALSDARAALRHPFSEAAASALLQPAAPRLPVSPALRLRFETAEQAFFPAKAERVILPLRELLSAPQLLDGSAGKLAAELPVLLYPGDEEKTLTQLCALKEKGLQYALCENVGAAALAQKAGLTPLGGMHLNIMNAAAVGAYKALGVKDLTLSFELNFRETPAPIEGCRTGIVAYGYLPLMRLRNCPAKKAAGCAGCGGRPFLTDRRGTAFPMVCADKKYSTLLNSVPLYTGDLKMPPLDFYTLYFTVESPETCRKVTADFLARRPFAGEKTAGLYLRKVL